MINKSAQSNSGTGPCRGRLPGSMYAVYLLSFCGICAVCTLTNVLYFSVRMRSRNAVRAVGGGLLTSIHEYRISCNRSPRLVLEQYRATRGLH